ncbi:hypothetical protein H181DRAFT_01695 [Streptomyces sp. WMMB 714]|uniref:hypothetical protein n=1 Tax=Streptomyces sp. WMMB 714 TaxID=1286822 RepID=UPI0005F83553|nr:hypothetical protein [Streptomyces sp. WMMB 714]SCK22817.1 hypothetical protein H181DRAFT_01695 [Streptomyces sp. WMMB 714]
MRTGLLRTIGTVTALYGLAVTARPDLLAVPSGLVDGAGRTAGHTRISLRPLAWRDMASGAAMAAAPEGAALTTATLVRISADLGDALLLGATLPGRARRFGAVAVSLGWGALSVAGLLGRPRAGRGRTRGADGG